MKAKKTLKKKIAQSMRLVSNLTAFIIVLLLVLMTLSVVSPISYYFSKSFIMNIYKHFDNTMTTNRILSQAALNPSIIGSMGYNQILSLNKTKQPDTSANPIETLIDSGMNAELIIQVKSISEQEKKMLAFAVNKAYGELASTFSSDALGIDALLVTYKEADQLIFSYPPIEAFPLNYPPESSSKTTESHLFQHIYDNSKASIAFADDANNILGVLEVTVNPILIIGMTIPFVFLFIVAMLISALTVNILIRLLVKPLIRPLEAVNQQLVLQVNRQTTALSALNFEVKNPPLEIQQLMDNSKALLDRFSVITHEVEMQRDELEAQKEELEAQNIELEEQNLELIDTKDLLKRQQDQLVRSEKMASVGQLSAAIAHEINTPLGAIQSNAQMMDMILTALPSDEEALKNKSITLFPKLKASNEITLEATRRVVEIIKSLKNFSRIDQSDFQKYDVRDGFASVFILTSNLWKNRIKIVENYGVVPLIDCYPSLLNQAFMNVVVNAIQSMEEGGTLTITVENRNPMLWISIRDTGSGIQEGLLDIIFESGFTTKPADKGTGLGLSISKEIIDKHRGKIRAESELGIGTEMLIEIPIYQYKDTATEEDEDAI
jgi:signal transduction histidine kinase